MNFSEFVTNDYLVVPGCTLFIFLHKNNMATKLYPGQTLSGVVRLCCQATETYYETDVGPCHIELTTAVVQE